MTWQIEWIPLLILLGGGVVLTAGDIFMKEWVKNDSLVFFTVGILIYLVGMFFLAASFKFKNIGVASLMLVLFNIIALTIVSWFFFKETLSVPQLIGMVVGLISVSILELAD
jgi:multidrug transporter EmrE-like cation transporter